jgi:hypothetical protein
MPNQPAVSKLRPRPSGAAPRESKEGWTVVKGNYPVNYPSIKKKVELQVEGSS